MDIFLQYTFLSICKILIKIDTWIDFNIDSRGSSHGFTHGVFHKGDHTVENYESKQNNLLTSRRWNLITLPQYAHNTVELVSFSPMHVYKTYSHYNHTYILLHIFLLFCFGALHRGLFCFLVLVLNYIVESLLHIE